MAKNYCSVINCQLHGRSTSQFHMWFWSVIFINFFNKNKVNKQHKKNNSFSTTHHFLQRKGQITNMLLAWSKGWPLQSQGLRPCLYLGARGGWQTTHTHTHTHYSSITWWLLIDTRRSICRVLTTEQQYHDMPRRDIMFQWWQFNSQGTCCRNWGIHQCLSSLHLPDAQYKSHKYHRITYINTTELLT